MSKRGEDVHVYGRLIQSFAYLLFGPLHNPFFYSSSRDQAVYMHRLGLADAMNTGHRLQVGLRIPVGVIETERENENELVSTLSRENKTTTRQTLFYTHMHVSAVCKLIPNPPLRVDIRKIKSVLPGALNWLII